MGDERIAVTVWGGRISPVLDVAERALLLTVRKGRTIEKAELALPAGAGEMKLAAMRGLGVATLLCGAVSRGVAQRAEALGLRLVPFLAGGVEDVVRAYVAGKLPKEELTMPGSGAGRSAGAPAPAGRRRRRVRDRAHCSEDESS